jgi:hypothetical protein
MSTIVCCLGKVPVPIVAWTAGVTDGDEPTIAFWMSVPSSMSERVNGHASGHVLRTSQPPPSHTTVRIALGGSGRWSAGRSASSIARPGRSRGNGVCSRSASVGAMSARVGSPSTSIIPFSATWPGPQKRIGTSCTYGHGPE